MELLLHWDTAIFDVFYLKKNFYVKLKIIAMLLHSIYMLQQARHWLHILKCSWRIWLQNLILKVKDDPWNSMTKEEAWHGRTYCSEILRVCLVTWPVHWIVCPSRPLRNAQKLCPVLEHTRTQTDWVSLIGGLSGIGRMFPHGEDTLAAINMVLHSISHPEKVTSIWPRCNIAKYIFRRYLPVVKRLIFWKILWWHEGT